MKKTFKFFFEKFDTQFRMIDLLIQMFAIVEIFN